MEAFLVFFLNWFIYLQYTHNNRANAPEVL